MFLPLAARTVSFGRQSGAYGLEYDTPYSGWGDEEASGAGFSGYGGYSYGGK